MEKYDYSTLLLSRSEWIPTDDHNDDDDGGGGIDWNIIWFLLSLVGSIVVITVILLTVLLGALAPMLIQISLVLSPLCVFITFVVSLVTLNVPVALASVVMLTFQCWYACHVWHKVVRLLSTNVDVDDELMIVYLCVSIRSVEVRYIFIYECVPYIVHRMFLQSYVCAFN